MTARRQARARVPLLERPSTPSAVPEAFLIGRCIEVWADPNTENPTASAMRRFGQARDHWAASAGADAAEMRGLILDGAPWSIEHLTYVGQAERVGRPVRQLVRERFERVGLDRGQLPELIEQAHELYAASLGGGALSRAYKRGRTTTPRQLKIGSAL